MACAQSGRIAGVEPHGVLTQVLVGFDALGVAVADESVDEVVVLFESSFLLSSFLLSSFDSVAGVPFASLPSVAPFLA